jgi:hypothetical protein
MTTTTSSAIPQPGSRGWRDRISGSTGATVITVEPDGPDTVLELAYDEGGSGWWPLHALVFDAAGSAHQHPAEGLGAEHMLR